jgi:hypothetical protein
MKDGDRIIGLNLNAFNSLLNQLKDINDEVKDNEKCIP